MEVAFAVIYKPCMPGVPRSGKGKKGVPTSKFRVWVRVGDGAWEA